MRAWIGAGAIVLLCTTGTARAGSAPDLPARGRALVERAECGRCHAMPASQPSLAIARERSCAGCHAWIRAAREDPAAAARQRRRFPLWDRYMATVSSFLEVPDLVASAGRLDQAFVARYLRAPFKVRPGLPEGMIRTGFDEDEAAAVAAWLASLAPPARAWPDEARAAAAIPLSAAPADVAAGRALFARLACASCHALGAETRPATVPGPVAPHLVFVAERMRPDVTAAFIAEPAALGGQPRMPRYPISATDAARLRDYLFSAARAPQAVAVPEVPADAPLLERPVSYAEVRAQVLDRVCVHCHMDPRRNGGDGGPGNTGGLGFRGVGLDLESWNGIVRGALDERGRRVSILSPPPGGGEASLLARLRLRYQEHAGELAGPRAVQAAQSPGMPLGLPPLSPDQFRLVRTWVAQGAPGPAGPWKSAGGIAVSRRPPTQPPPARGRAGGGVRNTVP